MQLHNKAEQMAAEGPCLPGVCITAESVYAAEHSSLSDIDVQPIINA